MTGCIRIGGLLLVYPPGHPRAGQVIEFPIAPGAYEFTISARQVFNATFKVEINEDGQVRLELLESSGLPSPDGYGLTELERELLDGLARIIARDILRRREAA